MKQTTDIIENEEKVLDRNGKELSVGCKVRWYDPEEEYRDLDRIYEVYDITEDIIYILDKFSEVEVLPQEVEIID